MGALGLSGVLVLETLLYDFVDLMSGRLEPAIDTIAAKAKLARGTVVRALARLRAHGFLDWLRRTEPIEDADGAGPQVRQVTNAYWLKLRGRAAGLVRLILKKAPPVAKTREEVLAEASAERLEAMRARRPGISAADFLSDEVKAVLRRRAEQRLGQSASSITSQNPGSRG
jgi:DNA-binding transcriptional MocR family regulator